MTNRPHVLIFFEHRESSQGEAVNRQLEEAINQAGANTIVAYPSDPMRLDLFATDNSPETLAETRAGAELWMLADAVVVAGGLPDSQIRARLWGAQMLGKPVALVAVRDRLELQQKWQDRFTNLRVTCAEELGAFIREFVLAERAADPDRC